MELPYIFRPAAADLLPVYTHEVLYAFGIASCFVLSVPLSFPEVLQVLISEY